MSASPNAPTFNLKAVVQETGLKPDTLRAWERRYGLPEPQRTDSGHRLYSQNDIQLLKWLMARQQEGMNISRAIELWRRLESEENNPLQVMPIAKSATTAGTYYPPIPPPTRPGIVPSSNALKIGPVTSEISDTMSAMRAAWVAACLSFNEQEAEQIIAQAFGQFGVERVCIDLLQKGLAIIGEGWYAGHITVQQEHFASALASRRLETLMAATPAPTRPGRILVGCPPEEMHTLAPLMLSLLLRRQGWEILFLGANIPMEDFVATTQSARPHLVILTAQQLFTAASLREIGDLLYQVRVPMAYGGMIFTQLPDLHQHLTGHYLGATLEGALQRVDDLLLPTRLPQPAPPLAPAYEIALQQFRLQQAPIEAALWRNLAALDIPPTLLRKANLNFGRDIIAALTLGNVDYLGVNLQWIQGLLSNHYQMPEAMVMRYLRAYLAAAEFYLDNHSELLLHWFRNILEQETPYGTLR
jgi:MerR family transcriptional regulator, light-induced transcriptional regulator